MKALSVALALIVGALALALVWTNYSQVETIARLREQNGLLRAVIDQERRLCDHLEALNGSYDRTLTNVALWLGLKAPRGLGGG